MNFSVISEVSALQMAVSARLSEWKGAMASNVLDRVREMPHWDTSGMERPESLADLAHPRTAVYLLLNHNFAHSLCRVIGMDARAMIGRETRSHRLLPNLRPPRIDLTLTDRLHSVPASRIVLLLQKHPNVRLFIERENRPEVRLPASLISILLMNIMDGENVTFRAEGEGAAEVIDEIRKLNDVEWFAGDRRKSRAAIREIQATDVPGIVRQLREAMREFGEQELAAVYHVKSGRFVVGHILSTHKEIAKTAGFDDPLSYLRVNFDGRRGRLLACFAPGKEEEGKAGRDQFQKWLAELFFGLRF